MPEARLKFMVREWTGGVDMGMPVQRSRLMTADPNDHFGPPREFDTFEEADEAGKPHEKWGSYEVVAVRAKTRAPTE